MLKGWNGISRHSPRRKKRSSPHPDGLKPSVSAPLLSYKFPEILGSRGGIWRRLSECMRLYLQNFDGLMGVGGYLDPLLMRAIHRRPRIVAKFHDQVTLTYSTIRYCDCLNVCQSSYLQFIPPAMQLSCYPIRTNLHLQFIQWHHQAIRLSLNQFINHYKLYIFYGHM